MKQVDRTGWIGFVRGCGIIAWLIRFFSKGPISHVMIGKGKDRVLEATNPIVKLSRYSRRYKKEDRVVWYKIKGLSKSQAMGAIDDLEEKYIDKGYGFAQLIGYVWCVLYRGITGRVIKNPFEDGEKRVICAELGLYYLEHSVIEKITGSEFTVGINIHDPYFMNHIFSRVKDSDIFEKAK